MNKPDELMRLLDEQIGLFQQKHDVLRRMGACVRQGDLRGLAGLLAEEAALAAAMDQQEQRTRRLRETMAEAAGLPLQEVTLGRVVAALDGPAAMALGDRREKLLLAIQELQKESAAMARLIGCALEFNNELLSALFGAEQEGSIYSAQCAVEANPQVTTFRHSV
jgi:hypothetical protein